MSGRLNRRFTGAVSVNSRVQYNSENLLWREMAQNGRKHFVADSIKYASTCTYPNSLRFRPSTGIREHRRTGGKKSGGQKETSGGGVRRNFFPYLSKFHVTFTYFWYFQILYCICILFKVISPNFCPNYVYNLPDFTPMSVKTILAFARKITKARQVC